jgi:hypothetical protein
VENEAAVYFFRSNCVWSFDWRDNPVFKARRVEDEISFLGRILGRMSVTKSIPVPIPFYIGRCCFSASGRLDSHVYSSFNAFLFNESRSENRKRYMHVVVVYLWEVRYRGSLM